MIINKRFWFKEYASAKQAFSYDNPSNVTKFVKQWGGVSLSSLELSDDVASHIPPDADIYSVLVNSDSSRPKLSTEGASDARRYKVLVKDDDNEYSIYDEGHLTLKEANSVAKTVTKFYPIVLVYRQRVTDGADEVNGDLVNAGVFI